jgi:hypothetical protein
MTDSTSDRQPNFLRRFFFSPDGRLRSGWRLLLHWVLVIVLTGGFTLIGFLLVAVLLGEQAVSTPISQMGISVATALPAITLATWLARRFLDRRSFASLGFEYDPRARNQLLLGILIPLPLFGLIYLFEWIAGWLDFQVWSFQSLGWSGTLLGLLFGLLVFLAVGFYEELLTRGYQLQNLAESIGAPWAIGLTSLIFALLHAGNPGASWQSALGIFLAGLFLAYAWLRTRQLWLPIGLHIGWNFFQGTVFGFPVSGTGGFHLIQQTVSGPALITGGAFGPEAGLTGFAAMGLGALLVWYVTGGHQPAAMGAPPVPHKAADVLLAPRASHDVEMRS